MPVQWERANRYIRERYMRMYPEYMNYTVGPASLHMKRMNIHRALDFILGMNKDNCKHYTLAELTLKGDIDYGAEEYFDNEAKMAVRLANFISGFLQVRFAKLTIETKNNKLLAGLRPKSSICWKTSCR